MDEYDDDESWRNDEKVDALRKFVQHMGDPSQAMLMQKILEEATEQKLKEQFKRTKPEPDAQEMALKQLRRLESWFFEELGNARVPIHIEDGLGQAFQDALYMNMPEQRVFADLGPSQFDYEDLKRQVEGMKAELKDAQVRSDRKAARIKELEEDLKSKRGQIDRQGATIQKLQQEVETLKTEAELRLLPGYGLF